MSRHTVLVMSPACPFSAWVNLQGKITSQLTEIKIRHESIGFHLTPSQIKFLVCESTATTKKTNKLRLRLRWMDGFKILRFFSSKRDSAVAEGQSPRFSPMNKVRFLLFLQKQTLVMLISKHLN